MSLYVRILQALTIVAFIGAFAWFAGDAFHALGYAAAPGPGRFRLNIGLDLIVLAVGGPCLKVWKPSWRLAFWLAAAALMLGAALTPVFLPGFGFGWRFLMFALALLSAAAFGLAQLVVWLRGRNFRLWS